MCLPAAIAGKVGATLLGQTAATAANATLLAQQAFIGNMAIAQASLAIGTQYQSMKAQADQAKQQIKNQEIAAKNEAERLQRELTAGRLAEMQNNIIAAQEMQAITEKSMKAQSTATVAAGEAGVSGTAVTMLLGDLQREQADYEFAITQQLQFQDTATALEIQDARMRSMGILSDINQPLPTGTSNAELGLNLLSTGLGIQTQSAVLGDTLGMTPFTKKKESPIKQGTNV